MALTATVVFSSVSSAQLATVYEPPADTVFLESYNPHLMYWVVGSDTLGTPVHSVALESQTWSRSGQGLQVSVHLERLLPERSVSQDTFVVAPNGELLLINGRAPRGEQRTDLLPRLPTSVLEVGTR